uniref:Uncharacterized protein n=1 Tax=Anguilla anguilla TaxID=7936 RepID=A0A0E9SWA2_ANGAN
MFNFKMLQVQGAIK